MRPLYSRLKILKILKDDKAAETSVGLGLTLGGELATEVSSEDPCVKNIWGLYKSSLAKTSWSGTSYCRIHFLPFTRDGRGYAQNAPFINLWKYFTP